MSLTSSNCFENMIMNVISNSYHNFFTGKPLCYFSSDFQGNFTTQVPYDDLVGMENIDDLNSHYSKVTIDLDRIPVWGVCHQKNGHNFILAERKVAYHEISLMIYY